jgi:hypothetical protein
MKLSAYMLGSDAIQSLYDAVRTEPTPMINTRDNSRALSAFVARKTKIDAVLARLAGRSSVHFGRKPKR